MSWLLKPLMALPWKALAKLAAQAAMRTEVGKLAMRTVAEVELERAGDPGPVKHSYAVARILLYAAEAGLPWRKWLVNILIELAVGLKEKLFDAPDSETRATIPGPPIPSGGIGNGE